MALIEKTLYYLGILDDGLIEFRKTRRITDNVTGEVFEKHSRQILEPGQDVSAQPAKVRNICAIVWTPQVISDYQAWKAAQNP